MKNLTLRQLTVFCEVARQLSFARASQTLNLTPPAVTMQVRELESALDLTLFERHNRKVSLTTAGEYFLVYAKRLLGTLKEADDAMARFRRVETGVLTVGIVSTAKYFVPRLLARFCEEHPGVDVKLRVSQNREQLVALLRANEVDLAVMGRPPREMATRSEHFAAHPFVFVCPPRHPLTRLEAPGVAALEACPLIVREAESGTRNAMESFFLSHRFTPRIAMEMPSNETIKQAVMAGMGISFLSLHTIGLELRAGVLAVVPVAGTPVMRTWNVVHLLSRVLSPAAEAFRYFMIEHGESHLAPQDAALLVRPASAAVAEPAASLGVST